MEQNDKIDSIYGALAAQQHLIALLAARVCKLDHIEVAGLRPLVKAFQSDFQQISDAFVPGCYEQNIITVQIAYESEMDSIVAIAEAIASRTAN